MKECNRCKVTKSFSEFGRNGEGYQWHCKECMNAYRKLKSEKSPGTTKICTYCHKTLSLDSFAWDANRKDHRQAKCKTCKNLFYQKDKEKVKARTKANRTALQQYSEEYKATRGCAVCGYNRCKSALHFHHLDGNKDFNISTATQRNVSLKKLKQEIEKCVLVCANCHRELHEGLITYESCSSNISSRH